MIQKLLGTYRKLYTPNLLKPFAIKPPDINAIMLVFQLLIYNFIIMITMMVLKLQY